MWRVPAGFVSASAGDNRRQGLGGDLIAFEAGVLYNAAMNAQRAASLSVAAALTILIVSVAAQPPAQPPGPQPAPSPAPAQPSADAQGQRPAGEAQPARVTVPAAASSIANKPDAFYGQYVSIYATVEKSLTPLAFFSARTRFV